MPLMSWQQKIGAPVTWSIGRRGEAQDVHPGIIMDLVYVDDEFNGVVSTQPAALVAVKIKAQAENGGAEYVTYARRGQPILCRFLGPRATATADGESLKIEGLDDRSLEQVQMDIERAQAEWRASQAPVAPVAADALAV